MRYRRAWSEGGTYFFTLALENRNSRLLVENIAVLREVVREVRSRHPFEIIGWVVLPEHMHALWELPSGDTEYPKRWSLIKAGFSRRIPRGEYVSSSRRSKGERGIWQRRYWEHRIRDEKDLERHLDYLHYNPVKHGYVKRAADWRWSSIHRYIRAGWITPDWGLEDDFDAGFGERA